MVRSISMFAVVAAIGLLMHFCVALAWTTVFFLILMFVPAVRGIVASPIGLIAVACAYGPIIWTVMSRLLIPQFTHRPPVVNFRWWVQFAGHIPFVALPIVASLSSSKF